MEKKYVISLYDMNQVRQCVIFDSTVQQEGEAFDISIKNEMSGWKEMSFSIPYYMNDGSENPRVQYIHPEYLIKVNINNDEDWFLLQEPSEHHEGTKIYLQANCPHISANLKTKNLYLEFDDTNGIDTCENLVSKILTSTGWSVGTWDTFYEPDGVTERIRSYTSASKRGAYTMITEVCNLFFAYPVFHGDTKTVDIRSRSNKAGLMELTFGKNLDKVTRTLNSADVVTRLYVEGEYGDYGYVGIDDAVPFHDPTNGIIYQVSYGESEEEHDEAVIVGYSGSNDQYDVYIPSTVEINGVNYTVTGIGEEAFSSFSDLMSITIPDTVTSIADDAFDGCAGVEFGDGTSGVLIYSTSGSYADTWAEEHGFHHMENVNGISYLLNFDYYRELGAFTDTHERIAATYLNRARYVGREIYQLNTETETMRTELGQLWGQNWYVVYEDDTHYLGNGATEQNAILQSGDSIAVVQSDGSYEYQVVEDPDYFQPECEYMMKFGAPIYGTMGALEDSITAAEKVNPDDPRVNDLKSRLWGCMTQAHGLADNIHEKENQYASLVEFQKNNDLYFVNGIGEMLRDGYWSDPNYIPGQEQALYGDALNISSEMAKPKIQYNTTVITLSNMFGYLPEDFSINQTLRIYDEKIRIHDYAFVNSITLHPDAQHKDTIAISTDELNLGGKTFSSIMSRVTEAANMLEQNASVYKRAAALTAGGRVNTEVLDGQIDIIKQKLESSASNWYTDPNGNLIFESLDGRNAMMLSGSGFMLASSKDDAGNWNWRTFGTGEGFTADMITTGVLRAAVVTILGSDRFYWDEEAICIYPNEGDRSKQIRIGHYDLDNPNAYGIGFTNDDGHTWTTAIGYDGVHLSSIDELACLDLENDGLHITSSQGDAYLLLSNNSIQLYSSASSAAPTASIINDKMNISRAEITSSLRIGNFIFQPPASSRAGNISLIYDPI